MLEIMKLLKEFAVQIGSGGSAGFVEVCIMHPLDLVKTRLQLQTKVIKNDPLSYNGIFDCFKKMYAHEGLTSLWKGIVPPILAETPKRSVKFFTFEQYKKIFMFGSPIPTPMTFSLAGMCAGMTEAFFANPFEVVKVTLQSNQCKTKIGTWECTKQIIAENGIGLRGLNKGLTATVGRHGVFNTIYFGFYHSVKEYFPPYSDHRMELLRKICIGFASGTLASMANIPFDVVKSRIQGPQPVPGQIKYRTTIGSMKIVYVEEGFTALYKGLLPKVLRLGPGGAIMLLVYENMNTFLTQKFA